MERELQSCRQKKSEGQANVVTLVVLRASEDVEVIVSSRRNDASRRGLIVLQATRRRVKEGKVVTLTVLRASEKLKRVAVSSRSKSPKTEGMIS